MKRRKIEYLDQADLFELTDHPGNLYGIRLRLEPERQVLVLGTTGQQIAKFPEARAGPSLARLPLGPLRKNLEPPHPPERPIPRDALQSMVDAHLLTNPQRKRLLKGKII